MNTELHYRRLRRIRLLFAGLTGLAFIIAMALFYWQIIPGEGNGVWEPVEEARFRTRGSILDNEGHYLALDIVVYKLDAYPDQITATKTITGCFALVQDLMALVEIPDPERLVERLMNRQPGQVIIDRFTPYEVGRQVEKMGLAGLHLEPSFIRYYPEGELFGPVVGLTLLCH